MKVIPKDTIVFLRELKLNNNRDWFNKNKQRFNSIQSGVKEFANEDLQDRDIISSLVSLFAIINGAKIIRTHNVALQKKYMNLAQEFYKF